MKPILLVVNPSSAGGRTGRRWSTIAGHLRGIGLRFDTVLTSRRGEATQLARAGVREGRQVVAAVGGDGTINETAAGFFDDAGRPLDGETAFAVLPTGTGGDFRRTFGISPDPLLAARAILSGRRRRIDAGLATYEREPGGRESRVFVNIASVGIGGEVARRVNKVPKVLPGSATFLLATLRSLVVWRNQPMTVTIEGEAREVVAQQVVVANCQYFGGGMRMAPLADPGDGLFDVIVVGDVNLIDNARGLARIRGGTHLEADNPKWSLHRASRVAVSSPAKVRVEMDGEQPGVVPAEFQIVPSAITLMVP